MKQMAYLIVPDPTSPVPGEVDPELRFEAALAEDKAAVLGAVGAVDDALEGLLGVDPDVHGAAGARGLDRGLEVVPQPAVCMLGA